MKNAKNIVWFCLVILGKNLHAQNSTDIITYINTYKEFAISEMQRTGVPAAITLAQGIHETEAGTSDLVKKSNNHFGIKCKDTWTGAVVYHDDDSRGECFRGYNMAQDSYKDHSDFLRNSSRYSFLFQLDPTDYEAWAYGLKKAGYATNIKYSQILIRLIKDYNLEQYTLIAMGKMKASDEVVVSNNKERPSSDPVTVQAENITDKKNTVTLPAAPQYPAGEFYLNKTRVIFAHAGVSLLTIADQYNVSLSRLMDFNDIKNDEILIKDQLLYLQRKRKTGNNEFHIVQAGETLYDICQAEGIRMESLLQLNQLSGGEDPATGEKIYLRDEAPSKPLLESEKIRQRALYNQNDIKNTQANMVVPASSAVITHVVQTKETLYSISKKYGVDAGQLQQWNKLDSTGLKIGQELIVHKN